MQIKLALALLWLRLRGRSPWRVAQYPTDFTVIEWFSQKRNESEQDADKGVIPWVYAPEELEKQVILFSEGYTRMINSLHSQGLELSDDRVRSQDSNLNVWEVLKNANEEGPTRQPESKD